MSDGVVEEWRSGVSKTSTPALHHSNSFMFESVFPIFFLVVYIILMKYVLPRFGVPT